MFSERLFVERAVRRKRGFLVLSIVGVVVGLLLAVYYGYRGWTDPEYPLGIRAAIVVLILLSARHNLRQYRYAHILEKKGACNGG